jgi:Cu(I)/Ag(I) efflux system periplasmic protein CusF
MNVNRILAAVALAHALAAPAQTLPASGVERSAPQQVGAAVPQSDGEVRKVDKEQGKVTLRHGPIANLDMPAMTMVFKVADPKMLDTVKQGDKVKFAAENINGALTVTALEAAR